MQIVLLVLIAVLFLVGLVAFAVGRQGWNWGTITAGILVLLAALGFTVLAGMVGEQRRAWRAIVAEYQKQIAQKRDGLVPAADGSLEPDPDLKPLAALEDERARWQRVWNRVDEWGGRSWPTASFTPPGDGRPGTVTVEDVEKVTVVPGAEVYVFDNAEVGEEGRFLGAFRVEAVNGNILSISPAAPPTDDDRALWAKPREAVAVYETLPNDTWLAFHRTPKSDGAEPADEELALPTPKKIDPEDLLKHLEGRLEEVKQHAEEVPEDKWPEVIAALKAGDDPAGQYWAEVEFKEPHPFPIAGQEPIQFESGQTGEFDLETAQELKDRGVVEILKVTSRRSLIDPLTAIRGGEHVAGGGEGGGARVPIDGLISIRAMLEAEKRACEAMIERLKAAKATAEGQLAIHAKESEDLGDDLRNWQADAEAAEQMTQRFDRRVADLTDALDGVETAIVELGRELAGASALLTGEIDGAAPPPVRARAAAGPAAGRIP